MSSALALTREQRRISNALYAIAKRHRYQHAAAASTASHNHRSPRGGGANQRSHRTWAPLAYRGVQPSTPESSGQSDRTPTRPNTRRSDRGGASRGGASQRRGVYEQKREKIMSEKEKEGRLVGLHQEFGRLTKDYKLVFSADPLVGDMKFQKAKDWMQEKKFLMASIMQNLEQVFDDLHQVDNPPEWSQIERTEDLFRGLCRLTHSMIVLATEMHREGGAEIPEYRELAESALRNLVKFQSDRALLVATTKQRTKEKLQKSEPPKESYGFQGWIKGMLGGFAGSVPTAEMLEPTESVFDEAGMAHMDPTLGATQQLFRTVIWCVASSAQKDTGSLGDFSTLENEKSSLDGEGATQAKIAQRMVELLQLMPPTWVPIPLIVDQVLVVLSRVGTLESAAECNDIFRNHPNSNLLRFSTVLEAFVEAAKHERDRQRRETIVREAIAALSSSWNRHLPRHRIERINLCSIVLHCMSAADISYLPDMRDEADKIIKRALGTASYNTFLQRIATKKGRVDAQALRLVHFLVQIYASSGEERKLEDAKRMLEYMIEKDSEGVGIMILYPNMDTLNSVLKGLYRRQEGLHGRRDIDTLQQDVDYAMGLLDYMLTSKEVSCWPSETTFALLFRILSATKLEDVGERAEELLSKMEIRKSFPGSHDVRISLSAYHHTLHCWLEVARSSSGKDVCGRALQLLDKLDAQSVPLLFNDLEAQAVAQRIPLYDTDLRPNRNTYKLLLQICAEVKDPIERTRAAEVGKVVYRRMVESGISPNADTEELLKRCQAPPKAPDVDEVSDAESVMRLVKLAH